MIDSSWVPPSRVMKEVAYNLVRRLQSGAFHIDLYAKMSTREDLA